MMGSLLLIFRTFTSCLFIPSSPSKLALSWKPFGLIIAFILRNVIATPNAEPGRSYALFNQWNKAEYFLTWTVDTSLCAFATRDTPCVAMLGWPVDNVPGNALWLFDEQADSTYRIYSVDNSYSGGLSRLDVTNTGVDAFMGDVGLNNFGQQWKLYSNNDDISLQFYNSGWKKALDIDSKGEYTAAKHIHSPWMNEKTGDNYAGQRWQLVDKTPTKRVTYTSISTQTSTYKPDPTTQYIGGSNQEVTSTTTVDATQTVTQTVAARSFLRRDELTVPIALTITSTVDTTTSISTSITTLERETKVITTDGATNTKWETSTRTVIETAKVTAADKPASVVTKTVTNSGGVVATTILPNNAVDASEVTSKPPSASATDVTSGGAVNPAPPAKSNTPMIAGLAAGMGALFLGLVAVIAFFLRKRRKKQDDAALPIYAPVAPEATDDGKGELHAESRVVSPAMESRVVSSTEPWGAAENEKIVQPRSAELEGGFHATVAPSDFAAPDRNVVRYGTEGRYELDARR